MLKLLKIEWLKIKSYTAFIVIASCYIVGILAANYIVFLVTKSIGESSSGASALLGSYTPYSFYNTWQTTSYVTGCSLVMPALLMIMLCTNEFTYRTHRQNIIDGQNRQDFITVKVAMGVIGAVACTLLVILTALFFAAMSPGEFSLNSFSHVGFFFFKALSYNMIAVLFSVLLRRTGFAIGLFFIYLGAENIISQMLDIWSMKIKAQGGPDLGSLGDYLPMNAADGLLTFPDNSLKSLASGVMSTNYTYLVLAIASCYIILFYWLSSRRMQRSDL